MENKSARAKVQAFGGFLTAMVIPNIGAFIAWGFITALFIPTGWLPNEHFAKIVGPMITYLLPVMIGSTGGHLVGGKRGAVMGGIGTIGVIVGAEIPMFLGSMIMGPLGGLVIKYVDKALEKRIPAGFEMVINNFSLGIAGMLLCLLGFEVIGPAVLIANTFVKECIEALVHAGYLPLLSVINEPAKVLFLNNAIDQGVYYPLGMQQASVNGKSIFFMVASNPGPGLGLLLAFTLFGKGMSKRSAPGAMIIHFLGGIHELYFPYVLMKPLTIIAMIAGGMSGTWMFNLLDGGLVAGPSPGSIFAYLALTPKGSFLATIAGVTVGAGKWRVVRIGSWRSKSQTITAVRILSTRFAPITVIATDSTRFCPIECIQATNKSAPLPVTPPNSAVRSGTATTVTASVIITPLTTTFGRVRNQPARASQPATRPMTIATGANAAAIGSVSNPQSKLVSKPVSIPITGPSSTALIRVPMESRNIGNLTMLASCPPIILMAIDITINTSA